MFSRIDAVYVEYLIKFHITKDDVEVLALVSNESPKDLTYNLNIHESTGDAKRSWHWIKTQPVHLVEPQDTL